MIDTNALMTSKSYEWYTPRHIILRVRGLLGGIDLDPCTNALANEVVGAGRYFTPQQDGLSVRWQLAGSVYCNPPYGADIGQWISKFVNDWRARYFDNGALLIPARTDTHWFRELAEFPKAFLHGRLRFWGPEDRGYSATFPSVIVYTGDASSLYEHFGDIADILVRYSK